MKTNAKLILFILLFAAHATLLSAQSNLKQDALVLYNNGRYAESIAVCEQEINENPKRVESYVVMCWALVRNKQYSEAEQRALAGLQKFLVKPAIILEKITAQWSSFRNMLQMRLKAAAVSEQHIILWVKFTSGRLDISMRI